MTKRSVEKPEQDVAIRMPDAVVVASGGPSGRDTLRKTGLLIGREYKNRVTQRSFIISSVVLVLLVFFAPFIPTIVQLVQHISARPPQQTQVVVVNEAGAVAGMNGVALNSFVVSKLDGTNTSSSAPYAVSMQPPAAVDSLRVQVKQGKLDILLVLERSEQGELRFLYYNNTDANHDSNLGDIQTLTQFLAFLDTAHLLGLTSPQTTRLAAPPDLTMVYTQQNPRPASQIIAAYTLAFAGAFLIFLTVSLYANIVATGVAEEKGNRVMEILVNAVTPFQLLFGKIVGIGAACLTQMSCLVAVGIGALLLQEPIQKALFGASAGTFSQYLVSVSVPFYLLFLVYFLLGFLLYATLYAAMGALVNRQDEVENATILPRLVLICGWILVYVVIPAPNTSLVRVLSYIPCWTPLLMLVRVAAGTVAPWEIAMTIGLMLLAVAVCTWFAMRVYRLGVLMYGQRPGLRQLFKML